MRLSTIFRDFYEFPQHCTRTGGFYRRLILACNDFVRVTAGGHVPFGMNWFFDTVDDPGASGSGNPTIFMVTAPTAMSAPTLNDLGWPSSRPCCLRSEVWRSCDSGPEPEPQYAPFP